jgi:hypothetical protein
VVVTAILVAANVRSAFLKPLFLIMVMVKFHVCVRNQPINLEWDERLSNLSNKFIDLKQKASDAYSPQSAGMAPAPQSLEA